MNDILEQWAESTNALIESKLNQVRFDKTEICRVVQRDKDDDTKYLVTNEAGLTFEAYADDATYVRNQLVYVTVPQGNYELRKLIIAGYSENEETHQQLYVSPFENFVIRNKLILGNLTINAAVNGRLVNFRLDNYDYIGLEYTASTNCEERTGNFEIIIRFYDVITPSSTTLPIYTYTFDSKEINGNPYKLINNLKIQQLRNIEKQVSLLNIKYIRIELQCSEDFDDEDIEIYNPIIYFGYSKENAQKLYSKPVISNYTVNNNPYYMEAVWYLDGDQYIYNADYGFDPILYPTEYEYTLDWFQYIPGYSKTETDIPESGTYWKTVQNIDPAVSGFTYSNFTGSQKAKEYFKVGVEGPNGYYIESVSQEFINDAIPQTIGNSSSTDTITFSLGNADTSYNDGIYNDYGIDNKRLIGNKTYIIKVDSFSTGVEWNSEIQSVIWRMPARGTMLTVPEVDDPDHPHKKIPDPRWQLSSDENYYEYYSTANDDARQVPYAISNQFNYAKSNNAIQCIISRDGDTYQGSYRFSFGTQATAGSGYAFNIYPDTSDGILISGNSNEIIFTARLEDNNGEEVELESPLTVEWKLLGVDNSQTSTGLTFTVNKTIINDSSFAILQATIKNFTDQNGKAINLIAYYPIPRANAQGYYIEGASRIVYDFQGTGASFDKTPYKLFNGSTEITGLTWDIWQKDTSEESFNYPSINADNSLRPMATAPSGMKYCSIYAYTSDEEAGTFDIYYVQPLLIIQNSYAFSLLNTWNGANYIGDDIILSQLIGAGKKDSNNKYTGVLMGVLNKAGSNVNTTGLYGFETGVLRYKLDETGAFYVGNNSTDTYLSFNENNNRSTTGELVIKTKKFTLLTDTLEIYSNKEINNVDVGGQIVIKDNSNNERVKLGYIRTDSTDGNIYGLDIYDGALRVYASGRPTDNPAPNPALWIYDDNIYLNGKITNQYTTNPTSWLTVGYRQNTTHPSCDLYYTPANNQGSYLSFWPGYSDIQPQNYLRAVIDGYNGIEVNAHDVSNRSSSYLAINMNETFGRLEGTWRISNAWSINSNIVQKINGNKTVTVSLYNNLGDGCFSIKDTDRSNITWDDWPFSVHLDGSVATTQLNIRGPLDVKANSYYGKHGIRFYPGDAFNKPTGYTADDDVFSIYPSISSNSLNCMVISGYGGIRLRDHKSQNYILEAYYDTSTSKRKGYLNGDWYTQGSIINGSDRKIKNSINSFTDPYSVFFDTLTPIRYKYNDGTSNRYHTGFISQDVEQALIKAGLTAQDFAGFVKDTENNYYLRYDEFIALNTWQIQQLKARVAELEQEIKEIQNEIK